MKRKGYAVVKITIQREIVIWLDDEKTVDQQAIVETEVEKQYGKLNLDIDEPDEVEILECDYAE